MNDRYKYSTSQLFNFTRDSYLERTSRPVYAIAFLLPFICLYEIGTLMINTDMLNQTQVRVVTFVWLQNFLEYLGAASRVAWIAPPVIVVMILIGLQVASRTQWYFCLTDYPLMLAECILFAIPLIVLSLFLNSPAAAPEAAAWGQLDRDCIRGPVDQTPLNEAGPSHIGIVNLQVSSIRPGGTLLTNIVTGIGAGIYEELVFRLILITLLVLLFQDVVGLTPQNAIVLSVLISAGLFSAHHHVVFADGRLGQGVPFDWTQFGFRTAAGVYFAALFAVRGFGITAGAHAFYDILATIVNVVFFAA